MKRVFLFLLTLVLLTSAFHATSLIAQAKDEEPSSSMKTEGEVILRVPQCPYHYVALIYV